jgi:hypothetical protein
MATNSKDRSVLRQLAEEYASIASLDIHKEKAGMWRKLNDLEKVRPMVWVMEICWNEVNVNDELTLQCVDPLCRSIEEPLRRTIYQWKHLPADMIVEPVFYMPLSIRDTGFGITEDVTIIGTDDSSNVVSREFHPQISEEKDLEKIKTPEIEYDAETTEMNVRTLNDIFGDILPVQKRGIVFNGFAPWDELIRWWGVMEAMVDLIMRPELVHAAMDRLVNAYLARLDQLENLNLLSYCEGNHRVGSGGLGYTKELPGPRFDPAHVRSHNQWGFATAQIFSDVSPEQHEEFALQYERRWLSRFPITYYGCCEPLHLKMDILKSVPNLRKISMSPWANVDMMVQETQLYSCSFTSILSQAFYVVNSCICGS